MARILLIEDNPDNLELMSYLLGAYGHAVSMAEDGESGIEAARSERPDLVDEIPVAGDPADLDTPEDVDRWTGPA